MAHDEKFRNSIISSVKKREGVVVRFGDLNDAIRDMKDTLSSLKDCKKGGSTTIIIIQGRGVQIILSGKEELLEEFKEISPGAG